MKTLKFKTSKTKEEIIAELIINEKLLEKRKDDVLNILSKHHLTLALDVIKQKESQTLIKAMDNLNAKIEILKWVLG